MTKQELRELGVKGNFTKLFGRDTGYSQEARLTLVHGCWRKINCLTLLNSRRDDEVWCETARGNVVILKIVKTLPKGNAALVLKDLLIPSLHSYLDTYKVAEEDANAYCILFLEKGSFLKDPAFVIGMKADYVEDDEHLCLNMRVFSIEQYQHV